MQKLTRFCLGFLSGWFVRNHVLQASSNKSGQSFSLVPANAINYYWRARTETVTRQKLNQSLQKKKHYLVKRFTSAYTIPSHDTHWRGIMHSTKHINRYKISCFVFFSIQILEQKIRKLTLSLSLSRDTERWRLSGIPVVPMTDSPWLLRPKWEIISHDVDWFAVAVNPKMHFTL